MLLNDFVRKTVWALGLFAAAWLGIRFLLPPLLPFALGLAIALAAEPAVRLGMNRCGLRRPVCSGVGVSLTLLLLGGLLSLLGAFAVREIGSLAKILPDVERTARQGMGVLQDWMVDLTQNLPEGARNLASGTVLNLLDDGTVLLEQVTDRVPALVGSVLGWVPDGALGLGTMVLSAFMFSARLPRLRQYLANRIPQSWKEKTLPALHRVLHSLGGWLKAQGKLMAVTYGILAVGLMVLGVKRGFLWALPIALVDAMPVLGTGTVLIPWAVVCLLQGNAFRGFGLLVVYGTALMTRTVLEPRFVGKHLGLDPLLTLLFFYVGYRLWGLTGMILTPLLASAVRSFIQPAQ